MLSDEQEYAFEKFKQGQNIFISGPGGCGKSFLIKHMYDYLDDELGTQGKMQITSTTGCSAVLLSTLIGTPCVKTIHSWSGIGMLKGTIEDIVTKLTHKRDALRNWKKIKILVIDEVSMLSAKMFIILETIARYARKSTAPFGGIQLVCLGDMYQLPPVPEPDDLESGQYCFEAPCWSSVFPLFNCMELKHIFRQKDPKFREILNQVRKGELTKENEEIICSCVGRTYNKEDHGGMVPMKILPTRMQVNAVNESEYQQVNERECCYRWNVVTNYLGNNSTAFVSQFYNKPWHLQSAKFQEMVISDLKRNIPTEEIVKLKKSVPVMCLVNLNLELGISNGSMGVVIDFAPYVDGSTDVPVVRFSNGVTMKIIPFVWQSVDYPNVAIAQIPLCLSYSSTIHKLQGSSLDMAEMNLGSSVFAEGQSYVGLSRVRTLDGLFLTSFHAHKIRVNEKVKEFYERFPQLDPSNSNATTTTTITDKSKNDPTNQDTKSIRSFFL